jgi:heme exporter protein A
MVGSQGEAAMIDMQRIAIMRGGRMVLQDFDLFAQSSELVWVRGANGSGKSTLLRAISGLLTPVTGTLSVKGSIALCDDNLALDLDGSLEAALKFWTQLDGISPKKLEAALEIFDLVSLAELPFRLLSAGQKKRGALARLIAANATIWLLDEPYNGLDQANVARLDGAISQHVEAGGIALVASHITPTINVTRSVMIERRAKARQAA